MTACNSHSRHEGIPTCVILRRYMMTYIVLALLAAVVVDRYWTLTHEQIRKEGQKARP